MSEIFNQSRMDRCAKIQRAIMEDWRKTNSFNYTVRATQSVYGISLDELRTHYFSVGVGDDLTELPFTDMLVVFSMIEQECAALTNRPNKPETDFTIRYMVTTDWPDEEAVRLRSRMRIETPFDTGKCLRIEATPQPPLGSEDGPQT
jgi:hypothetical protein